MKKLLVGALCLLSTLFAFSQESVSGYYITTDGQKVTGEYEYADFSLVSNLKFRTGEEQFTAPAIHNIREYGIADSYKFVKYRVDIDVAGAVSNSATPDKPVFLNQEVFLNVLVEGDATLYSYYDAVNKNTKYFIKTPGLPVPQQLVYRSYILNGRQAENNEYKVQLPGYLVCENFKGANIVKTDYNSSALVRYVKAYNDCKGSGSVVYSNNSGRKLSFNLGVYAGVYATSLDLKGNRLPSLHKDSGVNFGLGAELEMLFQSRKLGFFLRVEGENLDSETEGSFSADDNPFSHKVYVYQTKSAMISAILGPRYYFRLNDKGRLFVDASASYTAALGNFDVFSYVVSESTQYPRVKEMRYHLGSAVSFGGGVGYSYNNRFAVELRTNANRDIAGDAPDLAGIKMIYLRTGLNLRYTF